MIIITIITVSALILSPFVLLGLVELTNSNGRRVIRRRRRTHRRRN